MTPVKLKRAYVLSIIIIALAAVASAGGLFMPDLYRDDQSIKTAWFGNDIITLVFVVPMFIVVLFYCMRGSERAQLVWAGLLGYMLYNYAFYLFGAVFNSFFLIYVALFILSIYALILLLSHLDVKAIHLKFSEGTPVKLLSSFMLLLAFPLCIVEGEQIINFIINGKLPEVPTLIFALDLSLVVPNIFLAAVLLWRRRVWGYILSTIMLVKGITYGMVLITATASVANFSFSNKWDPLIVFYIFVFMGSLIGCLLLLNNFRSGKPKRNTYHRVVSLHRN